MRKEHAIAVFFGAIMVLSAAGFAISGINFNAGTGGPVQTPSVIDRELTREEFRSVLLSGKTIIRNRYALGCANCSAENGILAKFADDMKGFIVLEQFAVRYENETKLDIVGYDGRITEMERGSLNESSLLDTFCSTSYAQPRMCLMRDLLGGQADGQAAAAPSQ